MEASILNISIITLFIILLAAARELASPRGIFSKICSALGSIEIPALALLLFGLIVLGCLQIVLRNFLRSGIIWANPLMRHMVLWLGCLGSAAASSRIKHINIDVLTRLLPAGQKLLRDKIIFLATCLASALLGTAALKLVLDEKSYGEKSFLDINTWVLQLILPFAFYLIAYRSARHLFKSNREE